MAEQIEKGDYPRHLTHQSDQAYAFYMPEYAGRKSKIRNKKVKLSCLYRRDFKAHTLSDSDALITCMNQSALGDASESDSDMDDANTLTVDDSSDSTIARTIQVSKTRASAPRVPSATVTSSVPSQTGSQDASTYEPPRTPIKVTVPAGRAPTSREDWDAEIRENPEPASRIYTGTEYSAMLLNGPNLLPR